MAGVVAGGVGAMLRDEAVLLPHAGRDRFGFADASLQKARGRPFYRRDQTK
jgi:hypothetical protein